MNNPACMFSFFLAMCGSTLSAQNNAFTFQPLTIEDGLSSNRVTAIIQDKKGFMWIGTEDGLNRFDGYSFKVYRNNKVNKNSLSHNYVWSLKEDSAGNIWIGTNGGGLDKFDPVKEEFHHYRNDPENSASLSLDMVQCVYIDKGDNLWAGTWGGGLDLFDPETDSFRAYKHVPDDSQSLSGDRIWSIYQDSRDNLWVGTVDGGLNIFDKDSGTFRRFIPEQGSQSSVGVISPVTLHEDSKGYLWIGTHGSGLGRYDYENRTLTNFKSGASEGSISGDYIWRIFEDSQGLLWIATQSSGLNIYDHDSGKFSSISLNPNDPEDQSSNRVRTIYEDRTSVLWIGTLADGVHKVDRKPPEFATLKKQPNNPNSLPENFVYTLCEDRLGDIWIGTYNNLSRYDPITGEFEIYRTDKRGKNAVAGERVRYVFEDSRGDLWIGTYFGKLNKYNRETDSFVKYNLDVDGDNANLNNVRVIFEDSEGIIWFGLNGEGLVRYDRENESYEFFNTRSEGASKISGDAVLSIVEDSDGMLWLGTFGKGLNKFDRVSKTFDHFFSDEGDSTSLSDNSVTELYIDSNNVLWAGTFSGGLCRYDKESNGFETYNEEDGLSGNFVCGILKDDRQNLWISTSKGISRFNPTTMTFRNYDFTNGLQKGEFMPAARLKARDNRLYFGGVNGINYFHPDSLSAGALVPAIAVTSFKVHNSEVSLPKDIAYTDSVTLNYNEDNFSFEFAALDYTFPDRNQYAYMLEGLDKNWNYANNRRFANYTHLDPGEYVFRVKGSNNEGTWNEAGASIVIFIRPPFWATWWFQGMMALAFLGAAAFVYRRRISHFEKERRAQEEFSKRLIQSQEEERKRIASELHDSLGQNLLIIKNHADIGMKSKSQQIRRQQLNEISANASSAIDEVRRIAYNLHPHQLDRLGLTKALKSILTKIEKLSEIHFSDFIENIDGIFNKEHEITIYRIVQECINNIIKHSGATTAEIRITLGEDELFVRISDNGQGFDVTRDLMKSRGFGMKNLSERIKILAGRLNLESDIGEGTTISIWIPVTDGGDAEDQAE